MKRPGLCSQCFTEVFEIRAKFTQGELKGTPKSLGRPLDNFRRIDVPLSDGSEMPLTLCSDCFENPDFSIIWQNVLDAFDFEEKHRLELGGKPRNERQQRAVDKFLRKLRHMKIEVNNAA